MSQPEVKPHQLASVSLRKMADSLHAVIAADRAAYGQAVVERLAGPAGPLKASADWRTDGGLPVHAQLLRLAAADIQQGGAEFSHTLRSLWPIQERNGPQTEGEKIGLEFVARHRGTNFYTEETLGGRSYFTAVYADVATRLACVECHNAHPSSSRRDFKTNDVMGGIVIRVPLEF